MNTRKNKRKWAVVQYDNRPLPLNYKALQNINRKYCAHNGYKYIFIKEEMNIPPYWRKVKIVQDLLKSNKYKGIFWLDTDAVIHNMEISLDDLLVENKHFYYAPDRPRWITSFNAGVWFVLNTDIGKQIMDEWMKVYNKDDWMQVDGLWKTSGRWAGPTYEQGAFIKYVKPYIKNYIHMFPWFFMQTNIPSKEAFVLHFAANHKREIPAYLEKNHTDRSN
jgi:hypothetical protein